MRSKLVEGVDYYLENGRFVFTAHYHLKRGHCCNSKCRHCPYRKPDSLATNGGADAVEVLRIDMPKKIPGLG